MWGESKKKVCITALSLSTMCTKQHSAMYGRDHHSLEKHQPVLIVGVSIMNRQTDKNQMHEDGNVFSANSIPYLHVYRILSETETNQTKFAKKSSDSYPVYPSYVDDGDFDDGIPLSDVDVMPDAFHSTVLKKFADAIAGEPVTKKDEDDESKKQSIKTGNILQSIQLPEFEGKSCVVKDIVPCCDGHHILVNVWLYDSHRTSLMLSDDNVTSSSSGNSPTNEQLTSSSLHSEVKGIKDVSDESVKRTEENEFSISHCSHCTQEHISVCDEELNKNAGYNNNSKESQSENSSVDDVKNNEDRKSSIENCTNLQPIGCVLLCYSIVPSGSCRILLEEPFVTRNYFSSDTMLNCISLPLESTDLNEDTFSRVSETNFNSNCKKTQTSCCKFAATTVKGFVLIFSGKTLEVLAKLPPVSDDPKDYFVHILHCSGIDCLCACSSIGKLHFLDLVSSNDNNQNNVQSSEPTFVTDLSHHVDLGGFNGKMFWCFVLLLQIFLNILEKTLML